MYCLWHGDAKKNARMYRQWHNGCQTNMAFYSHTEEFLDGGLAAKKAQTVKPSKHLPELIVNMQIGCLMAIKVFFYGCSVFLPCPQNSSAYPGLLEGDNICVYMPYMCYLIKMVTLNLKGST